LTKENQENKVEIQNLTKEERENKAKIEKLTREFEAQEAKVNRMDTIMIEMNARNSKTCYIL
jgi:hypothetical protein